MSERARREYISPAIVLEIELETRAGSSLGEVLEELLEEE